MEKQKKYLKPEDSPRGDSGAVRLHRESLQAFSFFQISREKGGAGFSNWPPALF